MRRSIWKRWAAATAAILALILACAFVWRSQMLLSAIGGAISIVGLVVSLRAVFSPKRAADAMQWIEKASQRGAGPTPSPLKRAFLDELRRNDERVLEGLLISAFGGIISDFSGVLVAIVQSFG